METMRLLGYPAPVAFCLTFSGISGDEMTSSAGEGAAFGKFYHSNFAEDEGENHGLHERHLEKSL